ncbi:hypothetical protein B0H14DRAFT_3664816 [Mycena olivaceomarginata]|nr:hypothetical protein B0H14DRAFT_3664816 [Mycena olivaceomarginata]
MVVQEIWALTGFRFTVWDHRQSKSGHRTRFFCCQDERRKKKSKRSQDPNVRNRDTVGMKRFSCGSKLSISCRTHPTEREELTVTVQMEHSAHIPYLDVSMPQEALDMINANVEWLTPVAMVQRVQAAFPVVSAAQIHTAWRELSQGFWRRDDKQLPSTEKLLREYLDDVDVFEPEDVPDGVEMVCWGMKRIAEPLKGKIVEVGVDATYNTNSKHLELYSIMAEQEGAGFPLSYLLLSTSTATSIDDGKRHRALTAWAKCLRNAYNVHPVFTHVDKDLAEIGMLQTVFNAKLSTTPYDPALANSEFDFIDLTFVPWSQADNTEYEGGIIPETITPVVPATQRRQMLELSNGLRIFIPARSIPANVSLRTPASQAPPSDAPANTVHRENTSSTGAAPPTAHSSPQRITIEVEDEDSIDDEADDSGRPASRLNRAAKENAPPDEMRLQPQTSRSGRILKPIQNMDAADPTALAAAMRARTSSKPALAPAPARGRGNATATQSVPQPTALRAAGNENSDGQEKTTRTFCPARYRDSILTMLEKHYCAHPLLPGYAHPSSEGIRRWAVMQMYKFCFEHGLREVWAYLWENWYRPSRWKLWARSVHEQIPVLKTTMILENHWRRIKHDFLHHFHLPRCDFLAWILVVKLAPSYYRKLNSILTVSGRYRELPAWRQDFKRMWKKLGKKPITLPSTNRFLLCKHIVQAIKPVPAVFFLEVRRQRTVPFWVHASLKPREDTAGDASSESPVRVTEASGSLERAGDGDEDDSGDDSGDDGDDEEEEDVFVDMQKADEENLTFEETLDQHIDTIIEFANGLKYQRRFRDQRMLQALERDGGAFLRLARACLTKEKRLKSTRGGKTPSAWETSTSAAMYYRARPTCAAEQDN